MLFMGEAKYTTPPVGFDLSSAESALVLDGRTPLKASDRLIFLIILLILLNFIAVKIDKFNQRKIIRRWTQVTQNR